MLKKSRARPHVNKFIDESVRQILAETALAWAAGKELRRKMALGKAGAVVVNVPSQQWITQVGIAIDDLRHDICVIPRTSDKTKDGEDNVTASRKLAAGLTVAVVIASARSLPSIFKTVTDHTVTIGPPDATLVATVIRKVSEGRVPVSFKAVNVGVLDFDEIAGLIVVGANARVTAERIARAVEGKTVMSKAGENLPKLEDATEFGDAQAWALDLKKDVQDLRAGVIGWEDVDKGAVIYGPPGTGKTYFARVLGEATGLPVVIGSMGDFFAGGAGYLDSVLKAQRAVFEQARAAAPSILFLDEIDALPDLDQISPRGRDWWAPVVADFLQLLDGATSERSGVIVIGATNRIHAIAPAVLRPGRLERSIYMGPPDRDGIVRVFRHHLAGALGGVDLTQLAESCAARGVTAAVIMELVRSARRSARRAKRPMIYEDLRETVIPIDTRPLADRRRVAVHEAGHALAGSLWLQEEFLSVSIEPGLIPGSGGHTQFRYPESAFDTGEVSGRRVAALLAGRAAEILVYGSASSGAGGSADSDLGRAMAALATGSLSYGWGKVPRWRCEPGDAVAALNLDRDLRLEVERDLARAAEDAIAALGQHRPALDAIVEALLERRTLTASEVAELVRDNSGHTQATEAA